MIQQVYSYSQLMENGVTELFAKAERAKRRYAPMPQLDITTQEAEAFLKCNLQYSELIIPMLPQKILYNLEFWQKNITILPTVAVETYLQCAPEQIRNNKEFFTFLISKCNLNLGFNLNLGASLADDKNWIMDEMQKTRYRNEQVYLNNHPVKCKLEDLDKESAVALSLLEACSPNLKNDEELQLLGNAQCNKGYNKCAIKPGNVLMSNKQFILKVLKVNPFFYKELFIPESPFLNDEEVALTFINSLAKFIELDEPWSWNFLHEVRGCEDRRITKIFKEIMSAFDAIKELRSQKDYKTIKEKSLMKYASRLVNKANKIALKRAEEERRLDQKLQDERIRIFDFNGLQEHNL